MFIVFIIFFIAVVGAIVYFLIKILGEQKQFQEEDKAYDEEERKRKELIKMQQSPEFYREQIRKYANDEVKLEEIEKVLQNNVRKAIKSGNKEEEMAFRQLLKSLNK